MGLGECERGGWTADDGQTEARWRRRAARVTNSTLGRAQDGLKGSGVHWYAAVGGGWKRETIDNKRVKGC